MNARGWSLGFFFAACVSAAAAVAACVGDEPTTSTGLDAGNAGNVDAGGTGDDSGVVDGGGGDADGAIDRVVQVSAGNRSSCALYESGAVYCWGDNSTAELGTGSAGADNVKPTKVPFSRRVTRISLGAYTGCAVEDDNTLWCWGENDTAELGKQPDAAPTCGASRCEVAPVLVPGLNVKDVALGFHFGCAITVDGHVACWGSNNFAQSGADPSTYLAPPAVVSGVSKVTKVAFGYEGHAACALDSAGAVWCWGNNSYGQLGHTPGAGSPTDGVGVGQPVNKIAQKVSMPGNVKVVDLVGTDAVCAVGDDGNVYCWGRNKGNELDLATGPDSNVHFTPVKVETLSNIASIAGGVSFCAISSSGTTSCWGPGALSPTATTDAGTGCTANGNATTVPCHGISVVGGPPLSFASVNSGHALAIGKDGTVLAWGDDKYGRVHSATPDDAGYVAVPSPVRDLP